MTVRPVDDSRPALRRSVSAKDVAAATGEDLSTIYKLLRDGEIEGYHGGPKAGSVMIYVDSVEAYQRRRLIEPAARQRRKVEPKPSPAGLASALQALRKAGVQV